MIKFFGISSEDMKKAIFSVKKYIAAGVSAAAFIVCAAIGAANTPQPETVPAETDVIPAETAAVTVCTEQAETDAFADKSESMTLRVNAAAFPYETGSSEEDAVNTAVPETEVREGDEEETAAAAEMPENEDDTDSEDDAVGEDEIFCDDAEVPTGSFADETVTSARVRKVSARTSERVNVRVVAPEMSPYSDEEYTEAPGVSATAADEPEQEDEESGAYEDEEIFEDEQGFASPVDPEAVERVSRFDVPDWLELDDNGVPVRYTEAITGKSCAYTAEPDALMSTGKPVFQGYVAVDPDIIPYGSELYIIAEDGEVYGYAIAADTGYSVREGHIIVDLFMDEYDDCIEWGAKNVTIYVLRTNEDE